MLAFRDRLDCSVAQSTVRMSRTSGLAGPVTEYRVLIPIVGTNPAIRPWHKLASTDYPIRLLVRRFQALSSVWELKNSRRRAEAENRGDCAAPA